MRENITPSDSDNKLGLTNYSDINRYESEGIAQIEEYILFEFDCEQDITAKLLLDLHKMAFGVLYHWAGKYRTTTPVVGHLDLPPPSQVPIQLYQLLDNVNFRLGIVKTQDEIAELIAVAHHQFVVIHPFTNGNGRMARILTNLLSYKLGGNAITLYSHAGSSRKEYIGVLREADMNNYLPLIEMIKNQLSV